jgi:hypothetical protein
VQQLDGEVVVLGPLAPVVQLDGVELLGRALIAAPRPLVGLDQPRLQDLPAVAVDLPLLDPVARRLELGARRGQRLAGVDLELATLEVLDHPAAGLGELARVALSQPGRRVDGDAGVAQRRQAAREVAEPPVLAAEQPADRSAVEAQQRPQLLAALANLVDRVVDRQLLDLGEGHVDLLGGDPAERLVERLVELDRVRHRLRLLHPGARRVVGEHVHEADVDRRDVRREGDEHSRRAGAGDHRHLGAEKPPDDPPGRPPGVSTRTSSAAQRSSARSTARTR